MNQIQQRRYPRIMTYLAVALRFPDVEPAEGWGWILDLSGNGVRVETRSPLRVGQGIYVSFQVSDQYVFENLRAEAVRVAWDMGYHIAALAFDETVDFDYVAEAVRFIASQGPNAFPLPPVRLEPLA